MKNSLRLIAVSMVLWSGLFSIANVKAASIPYVDAGAPDQNTYTFTATSTGYIGAYFQSSSAAFTNTLSLLVNGVITPQSSMGALNNQTSFNADGMNRIYSTAFTGDSILGTPAGTYLGFEDLYGGGDFDYNDEAFVFTNVSASTSKHVSPVPEPETYAMLLIGLGLIAFTIRRKTTA